MSEIRRVGVIGFGYWGKKLAQKFEELNVLKIVQDIDTHRAMNASTQLGTLWSDNLSNVLEGKREALDAVVIATPPETHYDIARQALEKGLHVFCEKPLGLTFQQANELENLAIGRGLRLQVGHIYLYATGLIAIPIPTGAAKLHIRLRNIAGAPSDSTRDLIWAGLPHAVSLAAHFIGNVPDTVWAQKRTNTIMVRLSYRHLDSECFIEIADFSGRRQRSAQLSYNNEVYIWHADSPSSYMSIQYGVEEIQQSGNIEPLFNECKDFLSGDVVYNRMGSRVAGIIDRIQTAIEAQTDVADNVDSDN